MTDDDEWDVCECKDCRNRREIVKALRKADVDAAGRIDSSAFSRDPMAIEKLRDQIKRGEDIDD